MCTRKSVQPLQQDWCKELLKPRQFEWTRDGYKYSSECECVSRQLGIDLGALFKKGTKKLQMVEVFWFIWWGFFGVVLFVCFLIKMNFHEKYWCFQDIGKFSFRSTLSVLFFFSRPQTLKNEPKEERQPEVTQLSPAGEENREDDKRDEGGLAVEQGNGLCWQVGRAPAEDVVAALSTKCWAAPEQS